MSMSPRLRKIVLTAHVTFSVGWLGAVVCFVALAIAGLIGKDPQVVQAAYLAMELTTWYVILPLALASLLTGIVESLGTEWGLFRHYWILAKVLINILSSLLLLVHMQLVSHLAQVVAETSMSASDLRALQVQLVAYAVAALLVLVLATALAVYKPKGVTPYGWRKQREERLARTETGL